MQPGDRQGGEAGLEAASSHAAAAAQCGVPIPSAKDWGLLCLDFISLWSMQKPKHKKGLSKNEH